MLLDGYQTRVVIRPLESSFITFPSTLGLQQLYASTTTQTVKPVDIQCDISRFCEGDKNVRIGLCTYVFNPFGSSIQ